MRLALQLLPNLSVLTKGCILAVLAVLPMLGLAGTRPAASMPPNVSAGPAAGWSTELGAAVLLNPRFQGSNSYRVLAVPYIDARFRDERGTLLFANVPQGIGGYLLRRGKPDNRFAVSLALAPGFSSRDPEDIDGIDTFGPAAEARLRLAYQKDAYSLEATFAQALGSGHEGFYLDLAYNWRGRLGRRGFFAVGPSMRFGDSQYVGALYGVSETEAAASGLSAFQAKRGLESIGFGGIASIPVPLPGMASWRFTSVLRYSRLLDDARASSLTQDSNQFFVLAALTRRL